MKKNLTELVFIIDRSGSMGGLESDTVGGINAVLKQHRAAEGETIVSTVLFDHESKVLHDRLSIEKVERLTERDYQVRGCTALLDAMGGAIHHIEKVQGYMPEEYKAEHVIFVITTDGLENASKKYTSRQVKSMVEAKKEEGWEFLFLGANIDAVETAATFGISEDRAATYVADSAGTAVMYDAVAQASMNMRCAAPSAPKMGGGWKKGILKDFASRKNR